MQYAGFLLGLLYDSEDEGKFFFRNINDFVRSPHFRILEELLLKQMYRHLLGARGSVVVKALCYNSEGRGFDTRRGDFINLPNPSGRTRHWGLLSL
jgi:hypothetical protein